MATALLLPPRGPRGLPPGHPARGRGGAPATQAVDALVVEDDECAVDIAEGLLGMLGYRTRVARDGHAALYEITKAIPDFILLDIHLPEMDGISFLRVLRKVKEAQQVPVVAVSAVYPPDGPVSRILGGLGVAEYLSKPFKLAALRNAIATAHPDGPLQRPAEVARKAPPPPRPGPYQEWGLACNGWVGGQETALIVEKAEPGEITILASPGVFEAGVTCRLECQVRLIERDAMHETMVRLLARATRPTGRKAGSERWRLDLQAVRPAEGLDLLIRALKG
jgi:CheY-like chemotaxis protein